MHKREHELYTSPKVEVVEIETGQLICQSGSTPSLNDDDIPYEF